MKTIIEKHTMKTGSLLLNLAGKTLSLSEILITWAKKLDKKIADESRKCGDRANMTTKELAYSAFIQLSGVEKTEMLKKLGGR